MLYWIYELPTWTVAFLFAACFVGFSLAGAVFIRPFLRLLVGRRPGLNDVVGYVLGFVSVVYGVLLGMLAIVTYQNLSEADRVSTLEASTLGALYRDVSVYPDPLGADLKSMLSDYTRYIIDEEWSLQRWGILAGSGNEKLSGFIRLLASFEPASKGQEVLHAATLHQFKKLVDLRRPRLHLGDSSIPGIMWYTVVVGAILCMMLIWLFDTGIMTQFVLGGIASFGISTMVCLSALMDNPFRGELSVTPQAFQTVFEVLMKS